MKYRWVANGVMFFHWLWSAVVVAGTPLQFFVSDYRFAHAIIVGITIGAKLLWMGGCPLVSLENYLRQKSDPEQIYQGSFIQHYIQQYFGIHLPRYFVDAALGVIAALTVLVWF